jgi:START domain
MRTVPRALWIVGCLCAGAPARAATGPAETWRLAYRHHELAVYQDGTSSKPSYKIEGTVDANLFSLMAVLSDIGHRTEWVRDLKESRIVAGNVESSVTIYERYHLPWPCHDRDSVAQSEIALDNKQLTVSVQYHEVVRVDVPSRPGIVRMPQTRGSMYFRYIDKSHSFARVVVKLDVGGRLPGWIVNWVARQVPAITVDSLLARVKTTRGQYRDFIQSHAAVARQQSALAFEADP